MHIHLGNLTVAKLLIQYGANINQIDQWGATPLYEAVRRGSN